MISLLKDDHCEVCGRCYFSCPYDAIRFCVGQCGNLEPIIDNEKCIFCGKCQSTCEERHKALRLPSDDISYYVARSKCSETVKMSSSGGALTAIVHALTQKTGNFAIFGVQYDPSNREICYRMAENEGQFHMMHKSKYVQSNAGGLKKQIEYALAEKDIVIFVGLPCMVSAIKAIYASKPNLFLVDLFCHGVSGAGLFRNYIDWIIEHHNQNVTNVDFRSDDTSEINYNLSIYDHKNAFFTENSSMNLFYQLYIGSQALKHACFSCEYATKIHPGDLTLGDFDNASIAQKLGFSLPHLSIIAANNEKGRSIIDKCSDSMRIVPICEREVIADYYRDHRNMQGQWGYNESQWTAFQRDYQENGFIAAAFRAVYAKEIILIDKLKAVYGRNCNVAIFGTKDIAKKLCQYLKLATPEISIKCYLATRRKENRKEIVGIPIVLLDEISTFGLKIDCVLVALSEKNKDLACTELGQRHINYLCLDS